MIFEPPNSYSKDPGILTIEDGDPSIEEIRRVFEKHGLELTQQSSLCDYKVAVSQDGILKKIYVAIVSSASYIYAYGYDALNELGITLK